MSESGVDRKVIDVVGPLLNLYKTKVEEYELLKQIYISDME